MPKDHKTIQAAIEAAKPGAKVIVEPGTYRESVRLKAGVILQSAGADAKGKLGLQRAEATIIDGGETAKGPAVVMDEGAVLDGFTITRVGLFDQKDYDKHYATQGENLPDDRGAVGAGKDFPAVGIPGVTATVRHCIVHDNGHAGIGCVGAKDKHNKSHIVKNIVYRNMGGGIGVADGAVPTVELNKCFNNLRGGIGNRNSAGLILKNECYDNVRAGIGIREGAKPIVKGNKCYKNRRAGIGVRMEGTAPVIEDNDCYENAMAGIGARDGATAKIFGNKCYRNKEAGIGTQLGAKAFIAHNECYGNEKAGIGQRSDADTTIGGNYVHHNKKAGIGFDDCKAGKSLVIHNRIIDNELVAIGIHAGWKVRVADNVLSRDGGMPPIVMVFKGAEADFVENTIKGSGVAGIRVEGTIRVINNKFECPTLRKGGGPPQFAVWGLPGSDIVFLENRVTGWRHALQADEASVMAAYNELAGYWETAIRVNRPTSPVTAIGNTFWSKAGNPGLTLPKNEGLVVDNWLEKADLPKEKRR
ncbi:MAG: DUF1565 domain-containing protein [Gemmataceae bacterium]|nr:DUF1565 domain-containing protein [Gemmataceae bacterium]